MSLPLSCSKGQFPTGSVLTPLGPVIIKRQRRSLHHHGNPRKVTVSLVSLQWPDLQQWAMTGTGKDTRQNLRAQTWAILTQTLRDDKLPTGHWLQWQEGQLSPTHGSLVLPLKRSCHHHPQPTSEGFPLLPLSSILQNSLPLPPISIICSSRKQKIHSASLLQILLSGLSSDTYKQLLPLHLRVHRCCL